MITVCFMNGSKAGYISGNNLCTAGGASAVQAGAAGLLPVQVKQHTEPPLLKTGQDTREVERAGKI